ncbi:P-loop containing nucleoside triphosphate hydrolase protein [Usnea florida]
MGQHTSRLHPQPTDPTKQLQVIGAGMSRTGTVSFGLALERLLDGPVYHGGEALALREESHIKTWIDILHHTPCKSAEDKHFVKARLREQLKGYVAVTDSPPINFVEELMELYPNAKVIATTRDPDDWWRSMAPLVRNSKMGFLGFAFYWLPTLRFFTTYVRAAEEGRYGELYFQEGNQTCVRETYGYHMDYLRRVVPKEKLVLYSVKEGWGPLCEILGVEVPDEGFPRANDGKAVEELFRGMVVKGLLRHEFCADSSTDAQDHRLA